MIACAHLACVAAPACLGEDEDDNDEYVREHPDLEGGAAAASSDYAEYPFLKLDCNKIELNGADWSAVRGKFAESADTLVSIVHIGDSHIQAEGSTSRTRALLQERYGNGGRGLVIPFRLAGTNQPRDYSITSAASFTVAKILKRPWPIEMGFTGISLKPGGGSYSITISLKHLEGPVQDFELVELFGHGKLPKVVSAEDEEGCERQCECEQAGDTLFVYLSRPVSEVTLRLESQGQCEIFGFLLDNLMAGVQYSAIGNNGATFSAYNSIGTVGQGIKALAPDLVIISLGCNEAFGSTTEAELRSNIDVLVKNITRSNPQARILLTTPSECQRSTSRRSGKRKRRVKSYSVNANVPRMRQAILDYGRDHGVATYDWYEVAGGDGSSEHWIETELMSKDRVHNNWSGYALQGSLLYDALIDAIE